MKKHNLTGKIFGKLAVISRQGSDKSGKNSIWLCKCECGNFCCVVRCNLIQNHTNSCGCFAIENSIKIFTTHGKSYSKAYFHWTDMKTRCTNKKNKGYKNYGGRGITICERWLNSFENFLEDMGYPENEMSLERIDNKKGYFKENCKWIPKNQQAKNRHVNHYIKYKGDYITAREFWERTGKKSSYATCLKFVKMIKYFKELGYAINTD